MFELLLLLALLVLLGGVSGLELEVEIVEDDGSVDYFRYYHHDLDAFDAMIAEAQSYFGEGLQGPLTFRRTLVNRSVPDLLRLTNYNLTLALLTVERQLRHVNESLAYIDTMSSELPTLEQLQTQISTEFTAATVRPTQQPSLQPQSDTEPNNTLTIVTSQWPAVLDLRPVNVVRRRKKRWTDACIDKQPDTEIQLQAFVVEPGADIELPCQLCGESKVSRLTGRNWYKIERHDSDTETTWRPVPVSLDAHDDENLNRVFTTPDHTLIIKHFQPSDSGPYICRPYEVDLTGTVRSDLYEFRTQRLDYSSAAAMMLVWNSYTRSNVPAEDFFIFVDVIDQNRADIVTRLNTGSKYRKPKNATKNPDANVLLFTLWDEWAQCNICGRGTGERRRLGYCMVRKLFQNMSSRPEYLDQVLRLYPNGTHCQSSVFDEIPLIGERHNEIELAFCNMDCPPKKIDSGFDKIKHFALQLFGFETETPSVVRHQSIKVYNGEYLELDCPGALFDSSVVWTKDTEPIVALEISAKTNGRIDIDYINRLVFRPIEAVDNGDYRCIVDLNITANYTVKVEIELYEPPALEPYYSWLMYIFLGNTIILFSFWLFKYCHRYKRVRAGRTYIGKMFNKKKWRPEAVIKNLFTAGQEDEDRKVDIEEINEEEDLNTNVSANASRSGMSEDGMMADGMTDWNDADDEEQNVDSEFSSCRGQRRKMRSNRTTGSGSSSGTTRSVHTVSSSSWIDGIVDFHSSSSTSSTASSVHSEFDLSSDDVDIDQLGLDDDYGFSSTDSSVHNDL